MNKRRFNSTLALEGKKMMKSLVKGYKLTAQLFIIIGTSASFSGGD